jgi:hypothetical protein
MYLDDEMWLMDQVEEFLKEQSKIIRDRQRKHECLEQLLSIIDNQRVLIEELSEANEFARKLAQND